MHFCFNKLGLPIVGRGIHSSTFQLNVGAFFGMGIVPGVFTGCFGGV
jgi:hypothetical protein